MVPCPLPDVDELLTIAQMQIPTKNWPVVYQLAQEALLFAQIICGSTHRSVASCLSLMACALFHLSEFNLAVQHQSRALATFQTISGFDSPDAVAAGSQLATYLMKLGADSLWKAARHTTASAFLFELVGGPLYPDLHKTYNKLGSFFSELASPQDSAITLAALRCLQDSVRRQAWQAYWYSTRAAQLPSPPATSSAPPTAGASGAGGEGEKSRKNGSTVDHPGALDMLVQAQTLHGMAILYFTAVNNFKEALIHEKKAFTIYRTLFGEASSYTANSALYLKKFTEEAVAESAKLRDLERQTLAISQMSGQAGNGSAADVGSEETSSEGRRKTSRNKSRKSKGKR